eukprot:CAMPEP_0198304438 /NCGR_PEP_ID=MMETSP1449-20131203/57391_1 /TAXON_ID=420275 /ORGANISM="Attheya septentrionalis, Strain CCMP2084" /LENGTH=494 /DNA_ID=CAMNT_0044006961 /DNA_START=72 /DNA_END=1556 /DNA_ORIENTATION=+
MASPDNSSDSTVPQRPSQAIYFPAFTWDYYLKNDEKWGIGIVARRNIKKGELVFSDSLEFMFSDVIEGDYLLLQGHQNASKKSRTQVPSTLPVTREMILRTHGVPALTADPSGKTAGVIRWKLELPGMLCNHACDPNVTDESHDEAKGESYAARDIKKGEELTYNYLLQYYDRGPFFETCLCGSPSCLGSMMGFKALSHANKAKYLSAASGAVQALHRADIGEVLTPKEEEIVVPCQKTDDGVNRIVFPGPKNCASAEVEIKQDDEGKYAIYACKDFSFGEKVYDFWRQDWPFDGREPIDMVSSTKLNEGELPEGTVIRLDPLDCAVKDRSGHYQFSGWDLLTEHSCDPNLTYNDLNEDEEDDWQGTYAVKDIKTGDKLTIDFNSVLWDRSNSGNASECHCGTTTCVGTQAGFKFLPKEAQLERKLMTWRRVGPPYAGEKEEDTEYLGMALTPHVRKCWRADEQLGEDCPDTASDSSSSSGSSSSDDESSSDEE